MVTDTIKKVANAILDAGEGCQSGLVYVDPVEAAKAAIAVLETDAEPAKTAPSVAVKALEWVEETQYLEVWRARPDCGLVFTVEDDGFSASKYRTSVGQKVIGYFSTLIEGKAAAQADYEARIRSALSAQVQDVAVPDGWQLIPKEPTREMWAAMANTLYGYKNRHHDKVAGDLFQAMLAAAPAAKQKEKP